MDVIVERSRRKTLVLTVSREGQPLVRAPLTATDEEISAFVARHKRWLSARLAEQRPRLSFGDGAVLSLFGRDYIVRTGKAGIRGDEIFLPAEGREGALVSLLKRLTLGEMTRITSRLAGRSGIAYTSVGVSSARTRWGSCNKKGEIRYSFRIALLPREIAEYVAAHELSHILRFDHSPAFWREVGTLIPDYPARRRVLRSYGWAMNCL